MIKMARFLFCLLLPLTASRAQIGVNIFSEYQLGNLPHESPEDLSTLYTQFDLRYDHDNTTLGLRYEDFSSASKTTSYAHLAQRFFEWRKKRITVRLGHFYPTLGRGLVLRGFELPHVVFEQRQFRSRYGYYRDVDGMSVRGEWKRLSFLLLRGAPLDNTLPPGLENQHRRSGIIEGGQISVRPVLWLDVGNGYMRYERPNSVSDHYYTLFTEMNFNRLMRDAGLDASLNLYAEHARLNGGAGDFFATSKTHATYVSAGISWRRLGFSAEYKDYDRFENGINLPPILYPEHRYYLLNRSTHELLANYENGTQFEMTFRPWDNIFLLANHSRSVNELPFKNFEFKETFVEATLYVGDHYTLKAFYDRAKDEIKQENKRRTAGVNLESYLSGGYGVTFDFQHQTARRVEDYENIFFSLTVSHAPGLSIGVSVDRSTDPFDVDDKNTRDVAETSAQYRPAIQGAIRLNMDHELGFFYGARRGGLVCVSGTCYQVLPFEGFKVRWMGRF